MSLIIGLGNRARQGKDTVARFIKEKYSKEFGGPYDLIVHSFAHALKKEVNDAARELGGMYNLFQALKNNEIVGAPSLPDWVKFDPNPPMDDPLCEEFGKQRFILQWWGTEYRRAQNSFYWVDQLDVYVTQRNPQIVIITDLRFRNEYAYIHNAKGWTAKVERIDYSSDVNTQHVSERELSNAVFDPVILCEDNLDELRRCAYEAFDYIIAQETALPDSPLVNVVVKNASETVSA